MLVFETPKDLDLTLDAMRSIGGEGDYLSQELLPALMKGDWDELDLMVIYRDDKKTILFGNDIWAFKESGIKVEGAENLNFNMVDNQVENCIVLRQSKSHLVNQIKAVALVQIWFSAKHIQLSSIKNIVNILKKDIAKLISCGITSFEELTQENLEALVCDGYFDLSESRPFKALNALSHLQELLPFKVNFTLLNHKMFNSSYEEPEGKLVIPPRIYFDALIGYSDEIAKAYKFRDEIEEGVQRMISFHDYEFKRKITDIRNGFSYSPTKSYQKTWDCFINTLCDEEIPLVDKGENLRWIQIFRSLQTRIEIKKNRLKKFKVRIGNTYYGWSDFRRYLLNLHAKASWLCLALSGMRVDELYRISPIYGAQEKTFNKNGSESDTGKEKIYFLTTRQSKITLNSQTKNDVFVTTEDGWKAFYVLNAIHTQYREMFEDEDKHRMFANLSNIAYCRPIGKNALNKAIKANFNKDNFDFTLTSEDMGYLQASDPTQKSFKQGDKFHFTPHQTRRSLAYYLIGYELCSFPALKQQLSHLSMAMTRWYARNAYSFEALHSEIQKERISQKAEIFARIYQKMANGTRIAGGKGKAMLNEISREGENYFENGVHKRKLSKEYWIEQLTNGKTHLHAIAPGMYCINTHCSMRINIDLSECVDCEYDFIEDVVYAEGSRMDAMRNIGLLKEYGELNSSSATKYFMQVKASEAIMEDLGFEHEKFKFEDDVLSLIIKSKMVV
ncbi:integrase [Vibrio cholerae]